MSKQIEIRVEKQEKRGQGNKLYRKTQLKCLIFRVYISDLYKCMKIL